MPATATVTPPPRAEQPTRSPQPIQKAEAAALTLSGIAWNKDSADRLAIINGQPIGVGGQISGAVVVEIHQDRVTLQQNGRATELAIGKSLTLH